jgi:hypothetical protein
MQRGFRELWNLLSPARQAAFAEQCASRAAARGLFVYRADADRRVPIPPILSPVVIDDAEAAALSTQSHQLLSAIQKTSEALITGQLPWADRRRIFVALSPFERERVQAGFAHARHVAIARADLFPAADGGHRALEMNATIPAMQGYSDAVTSAWFDAFGAAFGLADDAVATLRQQNGSNSADLLRSLLAHAARTGRTEVGSIAIVARAGDSQLGDLDAIARAWRQAGIEVEHCNPDEIAIDAGVATARGRRFDLWYRHIFAWRLDPAGAFATMLRDPVRFGVWNPVDPQLEVKAMLALTQRVAEEQPRLGGLTLSDAERHAALTLAPWTRLLAPGASTLDDGSAVTELLAHVAAHPGRYILKRSWAYGGKSVLLAEHLDDADTQSRLRTMFGLDAETPAIDWTRLVDLAANDRHDVWIVQRIVEPRTTEHLVTGAGGPRWQHLVADLSMYANHGVDTPMSGGAVRVSASRIVNIATGGGMAPLVRASVAGELFAAASRRLATT